MFVCGEKHFDIFISHLRWRSCGNNKTRRPFCGEARLQCGSTSTRLLTRKQVDLFCCRRSQWATYDSSLRTNSSHNNLWPVKCWNRRLGVSRLHNDSLSSYVFCLQEVQYTQKNLNLTYTSRSKRWSCCQAFLGKIWSFSNKTKIRIYT